MKQSVLKQVCMATMDWIVSTPNSDVESLNSDMMVKG